MKKRNNKQYNKVIDKVYQESNDINNDVISHTIYINNESKIHVLVVGIAINCSGDANGDSDNIMVIYMHNNIKFTRELNNFKQHFTKLL